MTILAVAAATFAAFVLSSVYYTVFGSRLAIVSDAAAAGEQPPPWKLAVEILRCLLLSAVVAGLAAEAAVDDPVEGLLLGLVLWAGFPLVLWIGAVVWENSPRLLALIHGGDWLAKLVVVGLIVAALQG
jgi:Protein of unknown function (DUF1761)